MAILLQVSFHVQYLCSQHSQLFPGSKLSDAGKQYSQASSNALKRLDSVEKKIEGIVHRVEDVASMVREPEIANSDDVTQLLKSKNELAQIMGDLERLQFKGVIFASNTFLFRPFK